MIYKHRKTLQYLEIKVDCGDIIQAYVLDNKFRRSIIPGKGFETTICQKHNLEVLA